MPSYRDFEFCSRFDIVDPFLTYLHGAAAADGTTSVRVVNSCFDFDACLAKAVRRLLCLWAFWYVMGKERLGKYRFLNIGTNNISLNPRHCYFHHMR